MLIASATARFVERGTEDDDRKFQQFGVDGLSAEALPYYARWIRQDVVGLFFMLNAYGLLTAVLLALVAVPLWMIALR